MSDSKEIYGSRPNPFISGFIYSVIGILIIAIIYSFFGSIEVVTTSNGIVRPNSDVSTVASEISGRVYSVNIFEGMVVEKNDILFSIDTSETKKSIDIIDEEINKTQKEIEYRDKYISGLNKYINPFSSDISNEEYPYYVRFDYFELMLKDTRNKLLTTDAENSIYESVYNEKIFKLEEDLKGLKALRSSIIENRNMLSDYPKYEHEYLVYQNDLDSLFLDFEKSKKDTESINSRDSNKEIIEQLKEYYDNLKEQKYYSKLTQIENSIQDAENELTNVKADLEIIKIQQKTVMDRKDANGNDIAISLLIKEHETTILNEKESLQKQLENLNAKKIQYQNQIELATVRAEKSGVISMINEITEGDIITNGIPIATIIPQNENRFKVQIYVSNADIGNIKVGDTVRYNIPALPSNQYDVSNGNVTKVSSDVLIKDGQYSGFYLVEADIENKTLIDRDGNTGNISIGMQVEVKIVTQKKSIIRFLLEKLDFF